MQLSAFSGSILALSEWITRLAYLNILWILFTLGGFVIFGFFPATIALLATLRQFLIKNDPPVFKTFLTYYKKEFSGSNKLGFIITIIGLILYLNIIFLQSTPSEVSRFLFNSSIVMSCIYFLVICYSLASYVAFDKPLKTHIKNSILITFYSPIPSLFIIFGFIAVYYAVTRIAGVGFFFSMSILGLVILSSANLAYKRVTRKQEELSGRVDG